MEAILTRFDPNDHDHKQIFQKTAIIIKSIGEIANTTVIDEEGNVSEISGVVADKIDTILRT